MLDALLEWSVVCLPTVLGILGVILSIKVPDAAHRVRWYIALLCFGVAISVFTGWQQSRSRASHNEEIEQLNRKIDKLGSKVATNEGVKKLLDPFTVMAKQRFPFVQQDEALKKLADQMISQRAQLHAISHYSSIAKLNMIGLTGTVKPPLEEETDIHKMLAGTYTIVNDRATVSCDATSIQKLKQVTTTYPDFPFSYYFLARCLKQSGSVDWKRYAAQAVEILKYTTMIDAHHRNHDDILRELKEDLAGAQ
jgi:hypothetical protein